MSVAVEVFRALADPSRLRIVALLKQMELAVGELAQVLGQSQPRVSRHIRILSDAGIVSRRREGSWVFVALAPVTRTGPLNAVLTLSGGDGQTQVDSARLTAVRADRAAVAARYFADHADEWDAVSVLHVADSAVEARVAALLEGPLGQLVDLGTGTGRMIELFAPRADHVIGIDRSPEMLRVARAKLDGAAHRELRQGDITSVPLQDGAADTVIIHQVLHYLPQPGEAIAEAARVLRPGGRLLIVDFAAHDHEELRTRDAHARLGFSDENISSWLAAAGLNLTTTEALDGGPLTIKLWLAARPALAKAIAA